MKFNPYEYQLIITAVTILWFNVFDLGGKLKRLVIKDPLKRAKSIKPFDCALCTHFWMGVILSTYFVITMQWNELFISLSLNTIISYTYERVQGNR